MKLAHITSTAVVVGFALMGGLFAGGQAAPDDLVKADKESAPKFFSRAALQRAEVLMQQMTLEEKVGQLNQVFVFVQSRKIDEAVGNGLYGSLISVTDPAQINRLQKIAVEQSRMHIPILFAFDVIHGFRTIFPVPIGMAASWDPAMVENAQAIAAKEASAAGIKWVFGPMVDIARDPRWGRIVEGPGEDPFLAAAMAAAQVRGFQGGHIGAGGKVLCSVKHFAGYGAAEGGRDMDASNLSDALLHNVYLQPFKAAVEAGVGTVMSAYMDLNDVPATGNRWLLREVLRDEWKFSGFVVSDNNAVDDLVSHGFARDEDDAAVRALTAGVNMAMGTSKTAFARLCAAVQNGLVTVQQIDEALRPVLAAKIALGLFEQPYVDEAKAEQVLGAPEHRVAARIAAERSAVLLRNEGKLLPFSKSAFKRIAVVGPLGDTRQNTLGPWSFNPKIEETVTVVSGLRSKLGSGVQVEFAPGVQIRRNTPSPFAGLNKEKSPPRWSESQSTEEFSKAIELARSADIVILTLGELQDMSGEVASRSSLTLPGRQQELMERVVELGKPVVLVLLNGRPLDITWANAHVPAILEAWYPGTQGGAAIANLLFGDAVPGGKLPITWPRNAGQIPIYYSHNLTQHPKGQATRYWDEPSSPLFPFGYGLSYSTFVFSDLKLSAAEIKPGGFVEVTATVENAGKMIADEVVQLYIHQRSGSASRPVRELKGFQRVTLAPSEKKVVRFTLGKDELKYWSASKKDWVNESANFDVWVGGDSNASLHADFEVIP